MIISSLLSNSALAGCPNAVSLKVGDTVKDCDRVGLSEPRANEVEKAIKQGELNLRVIQVQQDIIQQHEDKEASAVKEAALYRDDSQRERKEVDRLRNEGSTKFLVGVAVGVLGVFLAAKAGQAFMKR